MLCFESPRGRASSTLSRGAGAYLREVLAVDLVRARDKAVADRVELASRFLLTSRAAYRRGHYRDAVSRGYISRATHHERAVLLSAVVVHQDDALPGPGFYQLARDLGRRVEDEESFHRTALLEVHREYSASTF